MKSFGLSYEDARDKNHWRLRIMGTTGQPRYTGKMAVEMLCVWGLFCNIIKLEEWRHMTIGVQSSWVHDCIIWYTSGSVVNTQMQREKEKNQMIKVGISHVTCQVFLHHCIVHILRVCCINYVCRAYAGLYRWPASWADFWISEYSCSHNRLSRTCSTDSYGGIGINHWSLG